MVHYILLYINFLPSFLACLLCFYFTLFSKRKLTEPDKTLSQQSKIHDRQNKRRKKRRGPFPKDLDFRIIVGVEKDCQENMGYCIDLSNLLLLGLWLWLLWSLHLYRNFIFIYTLIVVCNNQRIETKYKHSECVIILHIPPRWWIGRQQFIGLPGRYQMRHSRLHNIHVVKLTLVVFMGYWSELRKLVTDTWEMKQ